MTEEEGPEVQETREELEEKLRKYEEEMEQYKQSVVTAKENRKYSEQEYDKSIVYLAGGGLALTIGFVKDILKITEATNVGLLLVSWICFSTCLLINLLSHSWSVNAADAFLTESTSWRWKDRLVAWANRACFWLVAAGIACFIIFTLQHLPYHVALFSSH